MLEGLNRKIIHNYIVINTVMQTVFCPLRVNVQLLFRLRRMSFKVCLEMKNESFGNVLLFIISKMAHGPNDDDDRNLTCPQPPEGDLRDVRSRCLCLKPPINRIQCCFYLVRWPSPASSEPLTPQRATPGLSRSTPSPLNPLRLPLIRSFPYLFSYL